jgi:hypothetical protein
MHSFTQTHTNSSPALTNVSYAADFRRIINVNIKKKLHEALVRNLDLGTLRVGDEINVAFKTVVTITTSSAMRWKTEFNLMSVAKLLEETHLARPEMLLWKEKPESPSRQITALVNKAISKKSGVAGEVTYKQDVEITIQSLLVYFQASQKTVTVVKYNPSHSSTNSLSSSSPQQNSVKLFKPKISRLRANKSVASAPVSSQANSQKRSNTQALNNATVRPTNKRPNKRPNNRQLTSVFTSAPDSNLFTPSAPVAANILADNIFSPDKELMTDFVRRLGKG